MQNLSGRLALVTGASAGIGEATARRLSAEGARVVLAARRMDRLEAIVKDLPNAQALELDVRDADGVRAKLSKFEFDLVIANAGMAKGTDPIQRVEPDAWDAMIDTNVKGVLAVIRACLPGMIARERGDMVLLGSVAGRQVYPGGNVYCATKHAVRALYEALRLDAAGSGIRFTTVDPGMVQTEFSDVRLGDQAKAKAVYDGFDPLLPDDVADAIAYAVTRPAHVNIGEIVLWPSAQASTTMVKRSE
jgi:3-hydroxy acid dehydrogenase/malonic semialdehyde reductase